MKLDLENLESFGGLHEMLNFAYNEAIEHGDDMNDNGNINKLIESVVSFVLLGAAIDGEDKKEFERVFTDERWVGVLGTFYNSIVMYRQMLFDLCRDELKRMQEQKKMS